jgi:hypothetical protein
MKAMNNNHIVRAEMLDMEQSGEKCVQQAMRNNT